MAATPKELKFPKIFRPRSTIRPFTECRLAFVGRDQLPRSGAFDRTYALAGSNSSRIWRKLERWFGRPRSPEIRSPTARNSPPTGDRGSDRCSMRKSAPMVLHQQKPHQAGLTGGSRSCRTPFAFAGLGITIGAWCTARPCSSFPVSARHTRSSRQASNSQLFTLKQQHQE